MNQTESIAQKSSNTLAIDLSSIDLSMRSGHLRVGGANPDGMEINATSRYLTFDGKPWFPVMGEFHYSRYPRDEWEEELLKMKAGGIEIVSSYVFWIHHEEEEGVWEWSGNHELRAFVELCQKHELYFFVRPGPWAHGEARNGGLPDWLLRKCGDDIRTNSEPYLGHVRTFYVEIAQQLEGLLWKDGGPVIGLQVENELTNNPGHLLKLKKLVQEQGLQVPLYTVTGWMRVQIPEHEMLPVFAGYPDAFWSPRTEGWARESRVNYFFSHNRDDATIGADLAKAGEGRTSETGSSYPYGAAELGGGMQVSYRRRPTIAADDVAALALCKIGSGSNLQGYYMYHGGANGLGRLSTLQESRETKYPNDMPVIDYDFQAPLGKYGQKRESYDALRIQHLFLQSFGRQLATMPMTLPARVPAGIDDRETLRWCVRSNGASGFVFFNNYQRIEHLPSQQQVQFLINLENQTLALPHIPFDIPAQSYGILPFNLEVGEVRLRYATAQLLSQIGDTMVFFAIEGIPPEFAFDAATLSRASQTHFKELKAGTDCFFSVISSKGGAVSFLVLTQEQALQAYVSDVCGKRHLFLSSSGMVFDGDEIRLSSRNPADLNLLVYPRHDACFGQPMDPDGVFGRISKSVSPMSLKLTWRQQRLPLHAVVSMDEQGSPLAPTDDDFADRAGIWYCEPIKIAEEVPHRVFLKIAYAGDALRFEVGGRLVDDGFYSGQATELELHRLGNEFEKNGLHLHLLPLAKNASIYLAEDLRPEFGSADEICEVQSMTLEFEYVVRVMLGDRF